jgi:hypothetical protein
VHKELGLIMKIPGQPDYTLVPYKENIFTLKEFSDYTMDFVIVDDTIKEMKLVSPGGTYTYIKK